MGELEAERLHLAAEPELLRLRQQRSDLVGADPRLDAVDAAVHPLPRLRVGVALRRRRGADGEGPVVAGPVAVEGVDDVEECLVAGPDDPVGEVVRVGVAALSGDRVDRLDLVGAHLVEPLVGERDDLVLADAGLQRLGDVLVDAVDHRAGLVEQHDLVGVLDDARVEHQLLGVDHAQPLALHLEEERRLDDVHADRHVRDPGLLEQRLDLRDGVDHQPDRRRDRAAEAEEAGAVVLLRHPRRVGLVVLHGRAEVPQHRVLAAREQRVADHLVAERAADPRLGGVADVVEVEEQERPALARLQRLPGAADPVVAQPREVDPLLVVDAHVARRREPPRGTQHAHVGLPLRPRPRRRGRRRRRRPRA